MTTKHVIRAWKDPEYRNALSQAERTLVPEHPAGMIELSDSDLGKVAGGWVFTDWLVCYTYRCATQACRTPSCPQ